MRQEAAQEAISTALSTDSAVADLLTQPTPEQQQALQVLRGCGEVADEEVQQLVWEAVGEWPERGTWDEIVELLATGMADAQAQIGQGAKAIATLRQASRVETSGNQEAPGGASMTRSEAYGLARQFMDGAGLSPAKADRLARRTARMWERGNKTEFPSFSLRNHSMVVEATYLIEDVESRRGP